MVIGGASLLLLPLAGIEDGLMEGDGGSAKRGCKLSLTGTAKRSTTRGAGRLKAHILCWSSGGRRANCGKDMPASPNWNELGIWD